MIPIDQDQRDATTGLGLIGAGLGLLNPALGAGFLIGLGGAVLLKLGAEEDTSGDNAGGDGQGDEPHDGGVSGGVEVRAPVPVVHRAFSQLDGMELKAPAAVVAAFNDSIATSAQAVGHGRALASSIHRHTTARFLGDGSGMRVQQIAAAHSFYGYRDALLTMSSGLNTFHDAYAEAGLPNPEVTVSEFKNYVMKLNRDGFGDHERRMLREIRSSLTERLVLAAALNRVVLGEVPDSRPLLENFGIVSRAIERIAQELPRTIRYSPQTD